MGCRLTIIFKSAGCRAVGWIRILFKNNTKLLHQPKLEVQIQGTKIKACFTDVNHSTTPSSWFSRTTVGVIHVF